MQSPDVPAVHVRHSAAQLIQLLSVDKNASFEHVVQLVAEEEQVTQE